MRGIGIAGLFALLLAGAAPAATSRPAMAGHAKVRLARLHAAADRALAAEPMRRAEGLPQPLGWVLMLFGFGTLGALLRERRHPGGTGGFDRLPFQ